MRTFLTRGVQKHTGYYKQYTGEHEKYTGEDDFGTDEQKSIRVSKLFTSVSRNVYELVEMYTGLYKMYTGGTRF